LSNESLAVILPTVKGRGDILAKAITSLQDAPLRYTFIFHDRDSCGAAWNEGVIMSLFAGDVTHVLFFADDLYAADPEWFKDGVECLANNEIPCPILLEEGTGKHWNVGDGNAGNQYAFSRIPMLTLEMARDIFPMPNIHYYSDCWIGSKAGSLGINSRVMEHYRFYHSWSPEGRKTDSDSNKDRALYEWSVSNL